MELIQNFQPNSFISAFFIVMKNFLLLRSLLRFFVIM